MRRLVPKLFLVLAILGTSNGKKDAGGETIKPEEWENYKFKPPSDKDYKKILEDAKKAEKEEDTENDEVDTNDDDMTLPDKADAVRAGTSNKDFRWPYEMKIQIDKGYGQKERNVLLSSIKTLNKAMPCFDFYVIPDGKKIAKNTDYLYITKDGKGCASKLGRRGGKQITTLASPCFKKLYGTAMHEIMHVLGFYHEHVRPDRDKWVTINFDELPNKEDDPNKVLQYEIRDEQTMFESKYDYESVMHYNLNNILVVNPKSPKKPGSKFKVGQRDHLSKSDIERINKMYPCDKHGKKPKGKKGRSFFVTKPRGRGRSPGPHFVQPGFKN